MDVDVSQSGARWLELMPRAVALVAGLSLWAQCAIGHAVELAWSAGGVAWRGTALLASAFALAAAVWRRAPALVYGVFPISLLGPILLLGDEARESLFSVWRWAAFCAAFVVWMVADAFSMPGAPGTDERTIEPDPSPGFGTDRVRDGLGLALLVVPLTTWLVAGRERVFVDQGGAHIVFVHLLVVFAWLVAWYTFFVTPALNDAWDRSMLERGARDRSSGPARRARRRLALALVAGGMCVVALSVLVASGTMMW